MRPIVTAVALLAYILASALNTANASVIDPVNNGFTSPNQSGGYEYGTITGWTGTGGFGLAANGSGFGVKASPSGQAAFMQGGNGTLGTGSSSISQVVTGFDNDMAAVTFLAEDRSAVSGYGAAQSLSVFLNGVLIDTVSPTSTAGFTSYTTPIVPVSFGSNTLSFAGGGSAGDSTSFVTGVSISVTPEPSTFILGGLGLAGFFVAAARRRRKV